MKIKKTGLLLTAAIIGLAACQKNAGNPADEVVFETTSIDMPWTASGIMAAGRDVENVIIDVPQLITISYDNLTIEEQYSGTGWEETLNMDLATAISNNTSRNIYTLDASRGRTIRVYNLRRRGGPVTIRIRAHRRHR